MVRSMTRSPILVSLLLAVLVLANGLSPAVLAADAPGLSSRDAADMSIAASIRAAIDASLSSAGQVGPNDVDPGRIEKPSGLAGPEADPSSIRLLSEQNYFESELNDTFATADVINNNYLGDPTYYIFGTITGDFYDVDMYRFTTPASGSLMIFGIWAGEYLDYGWEDDLLIGLFDSSQTLLYAADLVVFSDGTAGRYIDADIPAGTYYIAVMQSDAYPYLYVGESYGLSLDFAPTFTVTFNSQGGSYINPVIAPGNSRIDEPVLPTRVGYTFGGWYKDVGLTDDWDFSTDVVTSNMTLYAKWTLNQYQVAFVDWDGTILAVRTVYHGASAMPPSDPVREGHTFVGWDNSPTNIVSNTTINAIYRINQYTVTFRDWDGSVLESEIVDHGASATAPSVPDRYGYRFVGWSAPLDNVTGNRTLTALYEAATYSVTFLNWDGSALKTEQVQHGNAAIAPEPPPREGHIFAGWDVPFGSVESDLAVQARFVERQPDQYLVLYRDWNGSTLKYELVASGGSVLAPAAPTRRGYTFAGWDADSGVVTSNLVVTALYTINSYLFGYDGNGHSGGTGPAGGLFAYQSSFALDSAGSLFRVGYSFLAWNTEPDGSGTRYAVGDGFVMPLHNVILYAEWHINQYSIAYDGNGSDSGIVPAGGRYNFDTVLTVSASGDMARTGYLFRGWNTQPDGSGTHHDPGSPLRLPAQNLILYAQWIAIRYTVDFESGNGTGVGDIVTDFNTTIEAPINPTQSGYTFIGWYKDPGLTIPWNFATDVVTSNISLYGKWKINQYTITYNSNGGSAVPSVVAYYNSSLVLPSTPNRSGYVFAGWFRGADLLVPWNFARDRVSSDMTLFARWLKTPLTGLAVSSTGYNSLKLSWTLSSGANGYEVWRSTSSNGTYTLVASTSSTVFTNSWLETNTTYYYKVRAYYAIGTSKVLGGYSAIASGKPIPAVPANFTATSASYGSVKLAWTAVPGANGYQVYRATSSTGTYSLVTTLTSGTAASYTNTGLTCGSTYYYKIRAYRTVGTTKVYGNYTAVASGKPIPSVPVNFKAASASYSSIKLTWTAVSGASGYQVYRATSSTGTYSLVTTLTSGTAASYTNTGLACGSTYYYKIRAYRTVGTTKVYGNYTAVASGKPVPSVPGSFAAARSSSTSIRTSWTSVSGASGYEVWRSTSSAGTYTLVKTTTATSHTDTGLKTGTTYYYKARAYRLVGSTKVYGAYTAVKSAVP